METGTLALIIIAVILLQIAIVALVGLYRRRRQYHDLQANNESGTTIGSIPSVAKPVMHINA